MTEELTGQMMEEEEEREKLKIPQQIKNNTALPKQTQDSPDLKMSVIKQEPMKRDRQDLISTEFKRALLEVSVIMSRSEIRKLDKAIAAKKSDLKWLEQMFERENYSFEEYLKSCEKKSADAIKLFEKERKSKQEKNAAIEKLTEEIRTIKSEFAKIEEIPYNYKRHENILFKLSTQQWQEPQEAEALKAKALDEQNKECQETAIRQGLERGLESSPGSVPPSTKEPTLSTAHNETLLTNSKLDNDSSEYEQKLELYFSDSQQLLDLLKDLTEQNLSLIHKFTRVNELLVEPRQAIGITLKKMKEDEEKLMLQVNDNRDRIDKEKKRVFHLKKKVKLHDSLKTENQDIMLDAMGVKVTEVHCCCVDSRMTSLSTLEKLSSVEYRMSLLLQHIESIPLESLETLRQIKDSVRRSRLREANLRLEREKVKERMKKCMQRSLCDTKKISGRKFMPRCIPVKQKIKVNSKDNIPAKDELYAYLFTTEDIEKK